jgi:integrase
MAAPVVPVAAAVGTFLILKRWAEWMEVSGRHAETTRRQYRRYALAFLADVLIPLPELTEDDVVAYLAGLPTKGGMRGQTIRAMASLCAFAHRHGFIQTDPMTWLRVPRTRHGPAPFLDAEALDRVLTAAERLDPRARPTLELIYATGARVSSVCAATADDVDLTKHSISWRVTKGDRPYVSPLGQRGMQAVADLLDLADYHPARGPRTRRPTLVGVAPCIVQRWCKLAGEIAGTRCYPHLLRHTFCERIANDPTVPDIVVVELMNWADGSLLRRYAQARGELKAQAVAGL